MNPDDARRRLEEGGVLLCMGVPQGLPRACLRAPLMIEAALRLRALTLGGTAGTELHCDVAGLMVGPKFRGIKMIPPGLHLFCWDAGQDKVLRRAERRAVRVCCRRQPMRTHCARSRAVRRSHRAVHFAGTSQAQRHAR